MTYFSKFGGLEIENQKFGLSRMIDLGTFHIQTASLYF